MKITVNIEDFRIVEGFENEIPVIKSFIQIYELGIELKHVFDNRKKATDFLKRISVSNTNILGDIEIELNHWQKIEVNDEQIQKMSDFKEALEDFEQEKELVA